METKQLKPYKIILAVSKVTDIRAKQIQSRCRKREIVDARRLAMALIYDKCHLSLKATGALFGSVDHSTVLHSNMSYFDLLDTDKGFREKVNKVKLLLGIS